MVAKVLKGVLQDVVAHIGKTIRQISHILRFKFALIPVTGGLIGWYMVTKRLPHAKDLRLWLFLGTIFFLAEAALVDNQFWDFERDADNPRKWAQPPKIVYAMLRHLFTAIGVITAVSLYYTEDRKPHVGSAVFFTFLLVSGFGYTSPPLKIKGIPALDIAVNMIFMSFAPALMGYMVGGGKYTDIKIRNMLPFICIGGVVETSGIVVDMVTDINSHLHTSAVFGVDSLLKFLKCFYLVCWADEMIVLKHPLSRIFASLWLLCGTEMIGKLKNYNPESDDDYQDVRKFFHLSIAFAHMSYLEFEIR